MSVDDFPKQLELRIRSARMPIPPPVLPNIPLVIVQFGETTREIGVVPVQQSSTGKGLIYKPEQGSGILTMDMANLNLKEPITFSIKSGNGTHCSRKTNARQVVKTAEIGKVYYLGLQGVGTEHINYQNIDGVLEAFYCRKEFPYQIEFSVRILTDRDRVGDFDVERIKKIASSSHPYLIPNVYSVHYSLKDFGFQKLDKYRQILKGERMKGMIIDFDMRDIIRSFQIEQSKSDSSGAIVSACYSSHLEQNVMRQAQRGFYRHERIERYFKMLNVNETFQQIVRKNPQLDFGPVQNTPISSKDLRNFEEDFHSSGQKNPILHRIMMTYLKVRASESLELPLLYSKGLLFIASRILALIDYNWEIRVGLGRSSQQERFKAAFQLFLVFVLKISPYYKNDASVLCSDLMTCRILTKNNLRELGFKLNQQHISLDNLVASKLLELFSCEFPELNYRIWDFLVYVYGSKLKVNVYPMLGFTYLTFLEANNLTEFFPINDFMMTLVDNLNRIDPCEHTRKHIQEDMAKSLSNLTKRDQLVKKMRKIKFLMRFLDPEPTIHIPEQDNVAFRTTHGINSPHLPSNGQTPCNGSIQFLHILFKKLEIGQNNEMQPINVNVFFGPGEPPAKIYQGTKKIAYLNHYIKKPITRKSQLDLQIKINFYTFRFSKRLNLGTQGYPLDIVHKINLRFLPEKTRLLNDSLQTSIECIFVLESDRGSKIVPATLEYYNIVPIKLRDYDLSSSNNELLKASSQLRQHFDKMKNPLDQFGKPYISLEINTLKIGQVNWIKNSNVSMDKLKSIFRQVFYEQEDKQLRSAWSSIFKSFSYKNELQTFQLGRFLVSLTLQCRLSRHEKVSCLYSIVETYDGLRNKEGISAESVNALFEQIYIRLKYVPFYPFTIKTHGTILSGWLYLSKGSQFSTSASRVHYDKMDITGLLKTWTFIQQLVFKTRDLMMGDNGTEVGLSILKSLFDYTTHSKIITNGGCKIQITYQSGGAKWLWVCELDQKFKIKRRGQKFFGEFPVYQQINQSSSEAEVMYHCENILPLTDWTPITLDRFDEMVQNDALMNYFFCTERDIYSGIDEQLPTVQMTAEVFVDGELKNTHPINRLKTNFGCILGISLQSPILNIRRQIQSNGEFVKGLQYVCCKVDNTVVFDEDTTITYKYLIQIANGITYKQRIAPKIIQFHYKTSPINYPQVYTHYAVYRYGSGLEDWKPCRIIQKQDKSVIIVFFKQYPDAEFTAPNYEVRGPGFLPLELM